MAERRMFAKTIIDSDSFLDMPLSAQALYFHLSMRADDEGFINNPRKIQRMVGASDDDLKLLVAKNFIIPFESGIIVIKHWKIHNYIRGDRLQETRYQAERGLLGLDENGEYVLGGDVKEILAKEKRRIVYKESELPYSFSYKIRRAFEGKKCPVCDATMQSCNKLTMPTIQHNIPISKGGKHVIENISVICASCNNAIRTNETGSLNNEDVVKTWKAIAIAEEQRIDWFYNTDLLDAIDVGQVSANCPSNVSIGKDSIGKVSIVKDSIEDNSKDNNTNNIYISNDNIKQIYCTEITPKNKKNSSEKNFSDEIEQIVDYMNLVLGTRYTTKNETNNGFIRARLHEGHTVDDFKIVIDNMYRKWHEDAKMRSYLRPQTLFSSKFESYLNESAISQNRGVGVYDEHGKRQLANAERHGIKGTQDELPF